MSSLSKVKHLKLTDWSTPIQATGLLGGLFMGCLVVVVFGLEPIAQPLDYHRFADARACFGLANCGDVYSNFGFALAGLYGLWVLARDRALFGPEQKAIKALFWLFFIAVTAVSIGSTYYHLDPDNGRLFWDRLPITMAFLALFPAILADRINSRSGVYIAAVAIPAGIAALVYWIWTETLGAGDLRFYGLVQAYPLLCLMIVPWVFPTARYSQSKYIYSMVGLYGVAKLLEVFDERVLMLTGELISGHSLKHLVAAVACLVVVPMIRAGARLPQA
ncbi:MAG: alkaline phytoceramidase [Alphaproteobacteria bacterium]|nr:alkaline phytoceramidase [Alphaproteobacteria bacterium]